MNIIKFLGIFLFHRIWKIFRLFLWSVLGQNFCFERIKVFCWGPFLIKLQAWKIKFANDCFWSVPDWSTFLYYCNFARGAKRLDLSSKFLAWRFNCDDIKIMFVCIHLYVFKINSYTSQIKGNHTKLSVLSNFPYSALWYLLEVY